MIIIISGASHSGKTMLANKLMLKINYPYLSIDHLKMGLIRSHQTDLRPENDDKLTDYLWPIIMEMIKTAIENNQNLIIEGSYIPSNYKSYFDDVYFKSILFVCLAMSDKYIDDNYDVIKKYSNVIENRIDDSCYTKAFLKNDNHAFINSFKDDKDLIIIDDHYEDIIENIIKRIEKEINKK